MEIIKFFVDTPTAFIIALSIAGLMVGSFLNVVIYRYPTMLYREWCLLAKEILLEKGFQVSGAPNDKRLRDLKYGIVTPRSKCPHCNHLIRAWENIPVISYIVQKGRCSQCSKKISLRYPFIEIITGVAFTYIAFRFGVSWQTLIYLCVTALLIIQTFIDIDHKILPDPLNYFLLWLGLVSASLNLTIDLHESIYGALGGYLSLWIFYWIFKLITGKEGMGHGDFKLLAALGAFVGYKQLLMVIIMSAGVGAILGITMMLLKFSDRDTQIPFGPYLAIAGWITIFWGNDIIKNYFSAMGVQ
ncbi:prepilin peptidase [Pleionea sediminis]|uniref:prepilin peptidase n=1 Tax=Pleionea sediminis TaxID=2569479 RepID=UPI00118504E4|nr:A24 family peptidase [Pleionea sediminis]